MRFWAVRTGRHPCRGVRVGVRSGYRHSPPVVSPAPIVLSTQDRRESGNQNWKSAWARDVMARIGSGKNVDCITPVFPFDRVIESSVAKVQLADNEKPVSQTITSHPSA